MEKIFDVMSMDLQIHKSFPPILEINAIGNASTLGWQNAELNPYIYVKPPADGYYEFEFVAEPPTGYAGQMIAPIQARPFAWIDFPMDTLKGIRIHAKTNSLQQQIPSIEKSLKSSSEKSGNPRGLFHYQSESDEYLTAHATLNLKEQPPKLTVMGSIITYRANDTVRFVKAEPQGFVREVLVLNVEVKEGSGGMKGTPKQITPFELIDDAVSYTHVMINYKLGTKTIAINTLG